MRELKELKNLQLLIVPNITDATLAALREIGLLHALNRATAKGQKRPAGPEDVLALDLAELSDKFTDAGLKELKELKNLQKLKLSASFRITDAGLKELKEFKSLLELELDGTPVTDAGLRELKELKNLQKLSVVQTRITARDWGNSRACRRWSSTGPGSGTQD